MRKTRKVTIDNVFSLPLHYKLVPFQVTIQTDSKHDFSPIFPGLYHPFGSSFCRYFPRGSCLSHQESRRGRVRRTIRCWNGFTDKSVEWNRLKWNVLSLECFKDTNIDCFCVLFCAGRHDSRVVTLPSGLMYKGK